MQRADRLREADESIRELIEAARDVPDDAGMIEHNPDEGPRLFCCAGKIHFRYHSDDVIEHAADCWFLRLRAAVKKVQP